MLVVAYPPKGSMGRRSRGLPGIAAQWPVMRVSAGGGIYDWDIDGNNEGGANLPGVSHSQGSGTRIGSCR